MQPKPKGYTTFFSCVFRLKFEQMFCIIKSPGLEAGRNGIMTLLQRILRTLRSGRPARRLFHFDDTLLASLHTLARREQRTEEEIAEDLLHLGLAQRNASEARIRAWLSLSPRQQQVTALACLGCTNRQIAARLHLSPETIKVHLRSARLKFSAQSKAELQRILADWDFSQWR